MSAESDEMAIKAATLTRDTGISIALVLAIAAPVSIAAWKFSELGHSVVSLQIAVEELRAELRDSNSNRWTRANMRQWVALLSVQNVELVTPNPDDIE